MDLDQLKGDWQEFTGTVKKKWDKLTDDDLTAIAGKRDQLAGKLQESYGITRDEAERQIAEFERRYGDYDFDSPTRH
jgi:uncharacterized protein YjbJ (UPF0337 family)